MTRGQTRHGDYGFCSGDKIIPQLSNAKIKQLMLEITNGETPEKVDAATNVALGYRSNLILPTTKSNHHQYDP